MNKKDLDELRWVRVLSPVHIPKYLVEQIKDRDFTVEDFYKFQEINCLIDDDKGGKTINPFHHLYVLVDEENIVKGLLWFVVDSLTKCIFIHNYSVDKEYWHGGKAFERLSNHMKEILKKLKFKKIYLLNSYPKLCERYGFKRNRQVLMEYQLEEEVKDVKQHMDGVGKAQKERKHADTGAAAST